MLGFPLNCAAQAIKRSNLLQLEEPASYGCAILPLHAGSWDKTVDMSDFGPSHIINIKKEKRETDEETKQILRMLEKDDVSV